MNYFVNANKNLLTYSLIILIVIPIFGLNFFISFLGNLLLLIFLIPILLLLILFLAFNFYKSKMNICDNCGSLSFIQTENCINCGAKLDNISEMKELNKKPSESTIEVKAEEVK